MSEFYSGERSNVCRDLLCGYFSAYYHRVYNACAALYRAPDPETKIPHDNRFSLTEIWHKMGNTGEPTGEQLARVYHALADMSLTFITIADAQGPSNGYLLNLGFYGHMIRGEYSVDGVDIHKQPPLSGGSGKIDLAMIDPHGVVFRALIRWERIRRRKKSDDQRA